MAPIINEAKATGADSFIGFSYPPDTIQLTQQAITSDFNPKVFYLGALTSTPVYRNRFKENAEGVFSFGGYPDLEKVRAYVAEIKAKQNTEPDYATGGLTTWVALEMLQQAIERKGLDRAAVTEELRTGTFDTIIGPFKLVNNMPPQLPLVGQWQGGTFYPLAPADYPGVRKVLFPKPEWKK
jgi:branched-chain amino acid transport system substrate-binding protein